MNGKVGNEDGLRGKHVRVLNRNARQACPMTVPIMRCE